MCGQADSVVKRSDNSLPQSSAGERRRSIMQPLEKKLEMLIVSAALGTLCHAQTELTAMQPPVVPAAVAVLHPTEGSAVEGTVYFVQMNGDVQIIADIKGLAPNSIHGFHIHEYGDCTAPDAASAGEHYSLQGQKHGAPDDPEHHAGDLGNIQADMDGLARYETTVNFISVAGATNPVLGRAVVVHEKTDDLTSQPSGNTGGRLACGVIGLINPDYLLKQTSAIEPAGSGAVITNVPPLP
jgi:Cu-Zn family superoxide dismutase